FDFFRCETNSLQRRQVKHCAIVEAIYAQNRRASAVKRFVLVKPILWAVDDQLSQRHHRPPFRITRWVAEHIQEQRRHKLSSLCVRFATQAHDAFGTGQHVDDASLNIQRWDADMPTFHLSLLDGWWV